MENKELEEKSSPTSPITTIEKKTKPKDPGRIAAGKKLAEYNKKAREAKKAGREAKEIPNEKKKMKFQKKTIKKDHFHWHKFFQWSVLLFLLPDYITREKS